MALTDEERKARQKKHDAAYRQRHPERVKENRKRTRKNKPEKEQARAKRRSEVLRAYYLRKSYGISIEEYDRLLLEQKGLCAICLRAPTSGTRQKRLGVDHDHKTLKVRGLLCTGCNTGIGGLGDDPERLRAAADYVEKARSRV